MNPRQCTFIDKRTALQCDRPQFHNELCASHYRMDAAGKPLRPLRRANGLIAFALTLRLTSAETKRLRALAKVAGQAAHEWARLAVMKALSQGGKGRK